MTRMQGSTDDLRRDPIFRNSVERFIATNGSSDKVNAIESSGRGYCPNHWEQMANLGWLGLLIPEKYGGSGSRVGEMALIVERFASAGLLTPLFPTAIEAASLFALAGTEAQRTAWLPRIANGKLLVSISADEGRGEVPPGLDRMIVIQRGDGFHLKGRKMLLPYASEAESLICAADHDGVDSFSTLFHVPIEGSGIKSKPLSTSNGDALFAMEIDVELPGDSVLGQVGKARDYLDVAGDVACLLKCFELIGIGQRALQLTLDFVQSRVQFQQPIGKFQAVQHHSADMYLTLERVRVLSTEALRLLQQGSRSERAVSLAKVAAAEGIPELLRTAHQLHGGVGYSSGYPLEMLTRRAIAAQAAYGSATWHRRRLGRLLRRGANQFRRPDAHDLQYVATMNNVELRCQTSGAKDESTSA